MNILDSGPIVIRVTAEDKAWKMVAEVSDDTHEMVVYSHKGNRVYDLVNDGTVEFRIVFIGGENAE